MSSSQELSTDGAKDIDVDMTGAEATPKSLQADSNTQTFPWPRDWIDPPSYRPYKTQYKKPSKLGQGCASDAGDEKPWDGQYKTWSKKQTHEGLKSSQASSAAVANSKKNAKVPSVDVHDRNAMDVSGQDTSKPKRSGHRESRHTKTPTQPTAEHKDKSIKKGDGMDMDVKQQEDVQVDGQMDGPEERSDDAPKLPFGRVPKSTVYK